MNTKLISAISMICGAAAAAGVGIMFRKRLQPKVNWEEMSDKHLALMQLMNRWLQTKQQGKSVTDYLHRNNISTIAIYGASYVGERLYSELENTDIKVKYAIDNDKVSISAPINVCSLSDDLEKVDAIIVTPVFHYDEIEQAIKKVTDSRIIYLEDILYDI